MKSIHTIIILFIGFVLLGSCENDLELTNPNELSPETYFESEDQVKSAVNACYANLQTLGTYSRNLFYMFDNMSHENLGNPQLEQDKRIFLDFSFDASSALVTDYWNSFYRGINKTNFVIENESRINEIPESILSVELKNKYIGEAKFLRALYYFHIVTRFGDAPLFTVNPQNSEGFPRSPSSDIYNQIVLDLEDAATKLLPKGSDEPGRATSGAAYALLGKVQLYQENYQEAYDAFTNVYGNYTLEPNFFDNFIEQNPNGIESIFEVQYAPELGNAEFWFSTVSGAGPNEVSVRGQDYGMFDWFNVYPSDDLRAEFEEGDPRFDQSFYVVGDEYAGGVIDEIALDRPAGWRKYQNYYQQANENMQSGINMKIIRYADVLLMMAEAANEVTSQDEAIGYINEVRDRVDMPLLETGLSKAEVFEAIVHERKVELAGEQVRFPDLVRWGRAAEFLSEFGFQAGVHELFPIPENEIGTNVNISPGDQNPGY
jgi:hypothetical protein